MTDLASRFRFVLVRTSHPGNIGSAARAIRTMGFTRLELVAPEQFPSREADALAANAVSVLAEAGVHGSLVEGLAGATFALGLSARRRGVNLEELTPREGAARALAAAARGEQVALVFGNERTGLENGELARCHAMVRIPSVDDYSSLNLAQAVQVMAYEQRLALLGGAVPDAPPERDEPPADAAHMERFFDHLAQTLDAIDFHKGREPATIMLRLRRLFQRAQPDERELRILHGILADAERMAMLARSRGEK
ncbi:RNA methyltransferase [Fulvimonas soli]|jgi:tRNA (cytidine32/uridine32-2'-O)-methyltransferase|uniref:tRNA (cytidine/uridine-2'-O-)-methyltransferase TrmJ n=1 Tax=Fulvimonas soli TaxID=155197 RepID=A0A316HN44_9GAMM|nr:RNA methyltransferase [Fulvimonas soli]PWK81577.1 tRNA (cytidine32/uridine32-2'-O)-methyltransferase [Fulvimonas soli]TNY25290.1 RNA methyltransferase [Fulvimonas soli]